MNDPHMFSLQEGREIFYSTWHSRTDKSHLKNYPFNVLIIMRNDLTILAAGRRSGRLANGRISR